MKYDPPNFKILVPMVILLIGTVRFTAAVITWPKAGGGLLNANFQAMKGDYSGGFVESYRTDCLPLSSSLTNASTYAQFAVEDINGDGRNEVVVQAYDHVCAFDGTSGSPLWYYSLDIGLDATPLLEDVDGDGGTEVVALSRTRDVPGTVKVVVLRGTDGALKWSYVLSTSSLSTSSPTAYDLDGDGDMDVLVGCDDDTLYALDGGSGLPIWKFGADGDVRVTPAVSNGFIVFSSFTGTVYALDFSGNTLWQVSLGDSVWASPVMGQLDGTGRADVIVATLGTGRVMALSGDNGSTLWTYSMPAGVRTTPVLADMDGDGTSEVVIGDVAGNVRILNALNGTLEQSFSTSPNTGINPYWGMTAANIYPDAPGLEILITTETVFRYYPNRTFIYSYDGTRLFYRNNTGDGSTIADVDNDGCMEFITENEDATVPPGQRYSVYDSPTNTGASCGLLGRDSTGLNVRERETARHVGTAYDLSGRQVPFSTGGKIYIVREKNGVRKVILR